jgi:NAD(P)-dependent dehydrogenase (short-subunit alcohol dehydrogenase family)
MKKNTVAMAATAVGAALIARESARRSRAIEFRDRVVLITGGSRGLGFVIARRLAAEGARIALLARTADDLEAASAKLAESGADVFTAVCDVGDRQQSHDAVRAVADHHGGIDVLINNAGVIQVGPLQHMDFDDFENAMRVHFWGPLYSMFATRPFLGRSGAGRIVNVSSIGGKVAVPHLAPYTASKFALAGLSESLRAELAREGIVVTTVLPGLMRTGSPLRAGVKGNHEAEYAWFSVSDSLPLLSIGAERAAARIIEACRYGDPELIITPQAKLAIALNGIAPGLMSRIMTAANWLLPKPVGEEGNHEKEGQEAETTITRSPLTALTRQAAIRNNEHPANGRRRASAITASEQS